MNADDDLIEAQDAISFGDTSMFGDADELPEDPAQLAVVLNDENEQFLDVYTSVKDFGWTWQFDFPTGQFVRKGSGGQISTVEGKGAFAEWCMHVLHTERLTAFVYSNQIGVEFEEIVRSSAGAEIAAATLFARVEEALAVHDRFQRIEDFVASVDGSMINLTMKIITTDGPVEITGSISS